MVQAKILNQMMIFIKRVKLFVFRLLSRFKKRETIIDPVLNGPIRLAHISAFNYGNAGDVVLPLVLKDLFNSRLGMGAWQDRHVSKYVDDKVVSELNSGDGVVIGGGGLFLRDTNKNNSSGWQWNCTLPALDSINVPILVFAVGYNRFRGQEDFDDVFTESLNLLVKKAKFVGIRNSGGIKSLQPYLKSENLRQKLRFQPCMTTVISKLYPDLVPDYSSKENFVAFNCAFDRAELRGTSQEQMQAIARVALKLSKNRRIKYYSHMATDNLILEHFKAVGVPYELVEFRDPKACIQEYAKAGLVIGMRGHAQMIPFGCLTPILSIVSHNKMQWFLDDISQPGWGVDVDDSNFEQSLLIRADEILSNQKEAIDTISREQERLWQVTIENMTEIAGVLNK